MHTLTNCYRFTNQLKILKMQVLSILPNFLHVPNHTLLKICLSTPLKKIMDTVKNNVRFSSELPNH